MPKKRRQKNVLREEDIQKIVETRHRFEIGELKPGVVEDMER